MTSLPNKAALFDLGKTRVEAFCALNSLEVPGVVTYEAREWRYGSICAYWRPNETHICLARCAAIGVAGPAWSAPGYTVDRTPYGVLAHELGHSVDYKLAKRQRAAYFSDFSMFLREASGEEKISSYCPNDAEWFAEMFRVFVTNPELLSILRPRTYAAIVEMAGMKPLAGGWREAMALCPERHIVAAENKIRAAPRLL